MNNLNLFVYIFLISVTLCFSLEEQYSKNRFTIESKGEFTETLLKELKGIAFSLLHEITPSVYIFEYKGHVNSQKIKDLVMNAFKNQVAAMEPTRIYVNSIKPVLTTSNESDNTLNKTNLVCDYYYGMGVDKVWSRNITGKGVTIAINDLGIDTDLEDLEPNINKKLSKDLFNDNSDVSPEHFEEYIAVSPEFSDHGNHVTSVIAAVKGNNVCGAGIAYNATVVGIKMCTITIEKGKFGFKTDSEIVSRSLRYEINEIDIYVNAWIPGEHFDQLDLASRRAIDEAATKGRNGLGSIHVVPAGPYGNVLSNNINTITVNGLPRPGKSFANVTHDASVLTSGLQDGNNLTSDSMVTTVYGNKCVRSFKGISAAVSQISGIIALGLQANPAIKLRDVQHLLVQASEYENLLGIVKFETNGALRRFSEQFGFGLINADKFVQLAMEHTSVPELQSRNLFDYEERNIGFYTQIFEFCDHCYPNSSCLNMLEHVALNISFTSFANYVKLYLISPGGTMSLLMDFTIKQKYRSVIHNGNFLSVHFWDELPFGKWQVKVQSDASSKITTVLNISITLYGTSRGYNEKDPAHCASDYKKAKPNKSTVDSYHHEIYIVIFFIAGPVLVMAILCLFICGFCSRKSICPKFLICQVDMPGSHNDTRIQSEPESERLNMPETQL